MTQKQREAHINQIEDTLKSNGWYTDRWGNYRKDVNGKAYRVKGQKTSLRYEVKIGPQWVNILSDYYKNIEVVDNSLVIKGRVVK